MVNKKLIGNNLAQWEEIIPCPNAHKVVNSYPHNWNVFFAWMCLKTATIANYGYIFNGQGASMSFS